jgi:IS605 OrfB family transposase
MSAGKDKPRVFTRKIQLLLQTATKEEWVEGYGRLLEWQRIVTRAANLIVSHHYVQEQLKEMMYLTDRVRVRLADIHKDADGILTTSKMNTTYQLLSGKLKGEIPMSIIGALNSQTVAVFNREKKDYAEGKRSLRVYRQGQPIPVVSSAISGLKAVDKGEYAFRLFGMHFRTNFGRDASGNRRLFEELESGRQQLRDSFLEIGGKKLFLLAVFQRLPVGAALSPDRRVEAWLSLEIPIIALSGGRELRIGTSEEFLYRRLAIQEAMHRTQAALRYSKGGKGRTKKMRALQRFRALEKHYVQTRLHQYSARLIEFCRQEGAGVLVLHDQERKEAEAAEDPFVLRNWGYYGLKTKIDYKAAKYGITVILE